MTVDIAARKDAWLPEQDQAIVDLRGKELPWKTIAQEVGRSVEACCNRYRTIIPLEQRTRFATSKRWTVGDEATLKRLISEGKPPRQIAIEMGRARSCIYSKINYTAKIGTKVHVEYVARVFVPPACLEDRERRLAAVRDITSLLCGDPAPGHSALEKRQRAMA